jgi:hypothetical protein
VPPVHAPVPQYMYQPVVASGPNGMAITGLVLGIVGLALFWFVWASPLLGILATTFGGIGLHKANRTESGRGLAVAGLTLGVITLVVSMLIWIVAFAVTMGG